MTNEEIIRRWRATRMSRAQAGPLLTDSQILERFEAWRQFGYGNPEDAMAHIESMRVDGETERMTAAREAITAFTLATRERRRARIFAVPDDQGEPEVDVTEEVVSILDRLVHTMNWGSGFFDDDELRGFFKLADLLKVDVPDSVERP